MPIYEYYCQKCQQKFEVLVSLNGGARVTCPRCHDDRVKKLVSSFRLGGASSRTKSNSGSCPTCSSSSCSTCK